MPPSITACLLALSCLLPRPAVHAAPCRGSDCQAWRAAEYGMEASRSASIEGARGWAQAAFSGEGGAGPVSAPRSHGAAGPGPALKMDAPRSGKKDAGVPSPDSGDDGDEKPKALPAWAMLAGGAVLGGLQGFISGGPIGAAIGAAAGLGASYLFSKGHYGEAFGLTLGGMAGAAVAGPLGAVLGAALGGLAGHFIGKLFK